MVFLGSVGAFCCISCRRFSCCSKSDKTTKPEPTKNMSPTPNPVWTTDGTNYDTASTITAVEAMSPSLTGIINHNFRPPGTNNTSNLPDIAAASSMFPPGAMKTFYPQGKLYTDQQCQYNEKFRHDAWYLSGSFTQDPRKSKEVTEL